MTEHHDPSLDHLDERARAAARGLQAHVLERLDVDASLAHLPATRSRRTVGRVAAVAAVAALLAGSVVVLDRTSDDGRIRVELDEDGTELPDLEPGMLRPLGPRDGKDSIQLPLTVEPSTGLRDGTWVTVSGSGFEPGESVGLVQCAKEAGGDSPETRGGVDGCYIGDYVNVTADAAGVATGTYAVHRVLTTPLTGTVDCAAEAERCIVAMGALSDYDRSGGQAIVFDDGGEPVTIPTVTVTPNEGLADGDVVRVVADGLVPNSTMSLQVCSSDPVGCWQTGEATTIEHRDGEEGEAWAEQTVGLPVDGAGHLEGDVPVWRFLPGGEPGTYIDCAVSRCSLRLSGETAPPTVPLGFTPGGEGPVAPALAVDPSTGLAPGDEVVVRGAGLAPGVQVWLSLCAGPPGAPAMESFMCGGGESEPPVTNDDGTFETVFKIPDIGSFGGAIEDCFEECTMGGGDQDLQQGGQEVTCDDITSSCWITVEAYSDGPGLVGPPVFTTPPVLITFR